MPYLLCKMNKIIQRLLLEQSKFLERLSFHCQWIEEALLRSYYPLVEKEIELAKIEEQTNVLHIGGGIPYTAEVITRLTGANVVLLEMDSKVVDIAREWIISRKLEDKIKVVFANGTDFNVAGFDVIITSLNVAPKGKILSNIFNPCSRKTKIIYRSAKKPLEMIYEDNDILDRYKSCIEGYVHQQASVVGRSYLLVKNGKTK